MELINNTTRTLKDDLSVEIKAGSKLSIAAVKRAKVQHPNIRLFLMLPYLPEHGRSLPDMKGYDSTVYPEGMEKVPCKLAIPRLNHIMVKDSDYVIAYVVHSWGGAAATLEQTRKRERQGQLTILNSGA